MAVIRQTEFYGQQRLDIPHLRLIELASAGDFDVLAGKMLSGGGANILKGFTIDMSSAVGGKASALKVNVAGALIFHPGASDSGSMLSVPGSTPVEVLDPTSNSKVEGGWTANTDNFIGLDLVRASDDSTADIVQILDANTLKETPKTLPLARILGYRFVVSTQSFSSQTNVAPLAKVHVDASGNVTSVTDARSMMFRLGTGADDLNPLNTYPWNTRTDASIVSTTTADPFSGGDKDILSFKGWMNAVMTRLWELGGGPSWFSQATYGDMKLVRDSTTLFTNNDNFEWDGTHLHWRGLSVAFATGQTAWYNTVTDQLANGAQTDLADGDCLYVDVDRTQTAALTARKVALISLLASAPTVAGSRYVIAWRKGTKVYARDSMFEVGNSTSAGVATTIAFGTVKIYTANANPVVPLVDGSGYVISQGIMAADSLVPALTSSGGNHSFAPTSGNASIGNTGVGSSTTIKSPTLAIQSSIITTPAGRLSSNTIWVGTSTAAANLGALVGCPLGFMSVSSAGTSQFSEDGKTWGALAGTPSGGGSKYVTSATLAYGNGIIMAMVPNQSFADSDPDPASTLTLAKYTSGTGWTALPTPAQAATYYYGTLMYGTPGGVPTWVLLPNNDMSQPANPLMIYSTDNGATWQNGAICPYPGGGLGSGASYLHWGWSNTGWWSFAEGPSSKQIAKLTTPTVSPVFANLDGTNSPTGFATLPSGRMVASSVVWNTSAATTFNFYSDDGTTWTKTGAGTLPSATWGYNYPNPMVVNGKVLFMAGEMRSTIDGINWKVEGVMPGGVVGAAASNGRLLGESATSATAQNGIDYLSFYNAT